MPRNRLLSGLTALAFLLVTLVLAPAQAANKYKILHAFGKGDDGAGIYAGLSLDPKGNLYGATTGGGAHGEGTVFELTPNAGGKWMESILHSFCSLPHCKDGTASRTGVVLDQAGNLYGSANYGPTFKLVRDQNGTQSWTYSMIYDTGSDGLTLDQAGNLYSEWGPGKHKAGDVFELMWNGNNWTEKILYSFCSSKDCRDGILPQFSLTWDLAGNLYGVTIEGGAHKWGVAYQLQHTVSGWKEHVLYDFPTYAPGSSLTFDIAGNLYGTTFQEGPCDGTVYELLPQGKSRWKRTILYPFCNPAQNGGAPDEPVTFDPRTGFLYGTASAGGDPVCQCGVIFKLSPSANGKWKYSVLYKFHGPDGAGPNGLSLDSKGNLYGTTVAGGKYKYGVAFELIP
jgi:uncharacterized repeat protein (TIGR03803 family)